MKEPPALGAATSRQARNRWKLNGGALTCATRMTGPTRRLARLYGKGMHIDGDARERPDL